MSNFYKYAAIYDLLYGDKDYEAEAKYVACLLRKDRPAVRTILELGSGTGRHGRLLAAMGFDVHGVERSREMVAIAQNDMSKTATFTCQLGDICDIELGRKFDAVISLFHVISYQTSDDALHRVFNVAASHLKPGGVFLFDVWHGPAVLAQRPSERVKIVEDDFQRVVRTTRPTIDTRQNTVEVIFDVDCEDKCFGGRSFFRENHVLRYLFPSEVDFLAKLSSLRVIATEEFLTGRAPSIATWGVMYLLQNAAGNV